MQVLAWKLLSCIVVLAFYHRSLLLNRKRAERSICGPKSRVDAEGIRYAEMTFLILRTRFIFESELDFEKKKKLLVAVLKRRGAPHSASHKDEKRATYDACHAR